MRDLPALAVTAPVSVVARIPSSEMPKTHRVHVKLANGTEVIVPLYAATENNGVFGEVGEVYVPAALAFQAIWIYDIDAKKIIKNKTGRNFLVHLDVQEVTRQWLAYHRFVSARRDPSSPSFGTVDTTVRTT